MSQSPQSPDAPDAVESADPAGPAQPGTPETTPDDSASPDAGPAAPSGPAEPHSALALAALATVAVPGLNAARLALPQRRTERLSIIGVVDTQGRHWEVLEAFDEATGAELDAEAEVLRRIGRVVDAGHVSFGVSQSGGSLRSGGSHIQVRSYIEGRPIAVESLRPGPGLSAGLGKALGELHEMPTSVISESGLAVYSAEEVRQRWLALLDDAAPTGHVPPTLLNRWEGALEDTALWRFRPTVVHGDLAEENVLTAGGSVVAVKGWAQAHVGDPAEDMAWIYSSVPVDCLDSIEDAYEVARSEGVDRHLRDRAELVSELSLARWLMHGVRAQSRSVISDAVAMLKDLASQVGEEPLVAPATPRLAPVPGERVSADPDASTSEVTMVPVEDDEDD
ncbi:phosphotransferase [Actinomyces slackii]|uniref:Phosphotransferase enzyme family n=1 Tax=Actinomyces slackii TaxID=52774 RepID=A0A448KCW4_9ACTO|nr:phosphotransferase [Actinomyces slackii]VEG74761.1 Phosphotransferase enzyme family [Actinomyces slackii]